MLAAEGVSLHAVPDAPQPTRRSLSLGEPPEATRVRAVGFVGAVELESSGPLDQPYELEFHPYAVDASPEARVETWLVGSGEPQRLASSRPRRLAESIPTPPFALFQNRERIDLTPFVGRRIRLRWEIRDPQASAPLEAGLGSLKLRPLATEPPRPSILLICSDTHRFDFSLADEGPALMPRLAALAQQSVSYLRAWSTASWTLPAVSSALTGLFPRYHRTGRVLGRAPLEELSRRPLPPGSFAAPWEDLYLEISAHPEALETLPEILARHGYTTALVSANPFYVISGLAQDGHDVVVSAPNQSAGVLDAEALRLLARLPADRPLFLSVHYVDVHDFDQRYFQPQHPDMSLYAADQQQVREAYRKAVRRFDAELGVLLERWDEQRGRDESLIVFYADHGEHLLDPGHPDVPQPAELPVTYEQVSVPVLNHGNSMQESLLRIPLLLRYPASSGLAGLRIETPVSLVDLLPTVLDLLALDPAELSHPPQGRSLRRLAVAGPGAERLIFADHQLYGPPLASVRRGAYKLVLDPASGEAELRRVCLGCRPDGDPGEVVDEPALRAELLAALERHLAEGEAATAGLRSSHRADLDATAEQLRALGYAQ